MIHAAIDFVSALPKDLATLVLAILPISELRGAIPFGLHYQLSLPKVLTLSIIGNLLPVIPMLFLFEPASDYLRKFWVFKKFFNWLFERTKKKAALIEKYEALGLALFVAIPLPITGAWTGCIAATLFRVRMRYAILAITIGVCIAAAITTTFYFMGRGIIVSWFHV